MKRPSPAMTLYHYTEARNLRSILDNGLWPSTARSQADAKQGEGQYFSDLPPEKASCFSREIIAGALFDMPQRWNIEEPNGELPAIICLTVQLPASTVKNVGPLYDDPPTDEQLTSYSIWLHPTLETLPADTIRSVTDLHFFDPLE